MQHHHTGWFARYISHILVYTNGQRLRFEKGPWRSSDVILVYIRVLTRRRNAVFFILLNDLFVRPNLLSEKRGTFKIDICVQPSARENIRVHHMIFPFFVITSILLPKITSMEVQCYFHGSKIYFQNFCFLGSVFTSMVLPWK